MSRKSVQAGACGNWNNCVLEANLCPPGETYRSSREIQKVPGAHGGACVDSRSVQRISMSVGRCGTEGVCVNLAEACPPDARENFIEGLASGCTIAGDADDADSKTLYGSCNSRCSWSPLDCGPGENWNISSETCPCHQVRVGACDKEGRIFCAVSEKACDDSSKWVSALEMFSHNSKIDCFLCREPPIGLPPQQTEYIFETKEKSSVKNNSAIANFVAVGIITTLSLLGLGIFVYKKRQELKPKAVTMEGVQIIPPIDTVTQSVFDDDDDDISVL
mmetsp:Transcript_41686/g.81722  ORF Transcript_41686/g.81722 Transcript_41686/m.81722 type:complete len:276 (-) Transcript_41686:1-828(-)